MQRAQRAVITYRGGELEAWEQEDRWTVRLAELEASSRYVDLALADSSTTMKEHTDRRSRVTQAV